MTASRRLPREPSPLESRVVTCEHTSSIQLMRGSLDGLPMRNRFDSLTVKKHDSSRHSVEFKLPTTSSRCLASESSGMW